MDGLRETAAGGGGWDSSEEDDHGVPRPTPRPPDFSFGLVREVHNCFSMRFVWIHIRGAQESESIAPVLKHVFPVINAPFMRSSRKQELEGKKRVKGTTMARNVKWTAKAQVEVRQTPVEANVDTVLGTAVAVGVAGAPARPAVVEFYLPFLFKPKG